jgi:Holliday junction resolvase
LIEMSLSECPDDSEMPINESIIGDLLSLTSLLVNTASDSDAIHWGLVEPKLVFNMNGTYFMSSEVIEEMLLPYFSGQFGVQFSGAIDDYEELYNPKRVERAGVQEGVFGEDFDNALSAEYGLLTHQLIECWAEITDLHVETSQPVIIMGLEDLVCRIVEKRNLEADVVKRFFQVFTLYPRSEWSKPPKGFSSRDIAPWKFKRRLSCLVKPILQLSDDKVFLSLSLIRLGVAYFLGRAKDGEFNTEFFNSTVMRSYVGSMIEKRGADFTELVASNFEAKGWHVRKEVLMTTVGAPQELGDIDVLAIKDGVMLIFECKKLQMAKTVSEIADVCNRFRGEEKDELRKHLNRVSWSVNNLNTLLQRLNYRENVLSVRSALLTSTEMPMKYKKDLPIANEDIISFREIEDWLTAVEFRG